MTRQEAIAIIQKEYLCVCRECDTSRCERCDLVMPNKEPILEAYRMAIEVLEQTAWIPISEKYPDVCEDVLVTFTAGSINAVDIDSVSLSEWNDRTQDYGNFEGRGDDVIAWRPLPRPYKGGQA